MYQVDVVPNGDVLLSVAQANGMTIPLLVSSKILSISSPVFKAMLSAPMLEGQESEDGLRHVTIEDPYMAVLTIMRAIHLQGPEVPMTLSFAELRDVAIVTDKYDMLRALTPWIEIWSRRYIFSTHSSGFEDWLFMSWAFKKEEIFIRETAYWIPRTYYVDGKFTTGEIDYIWRLPQGIIERMEDERRRLADALMEVAYSEFEALKGSSDLCRQSSTYARCVYCNDLNLGQIIRRLIKARMYPEKAQARTLTVEEIARALVHEDVPQTSLFNVDVKPHHDCSVIERLKPSVSEVMGSVCGLTFLPRSARSSVETKRALEIVGERRASKEVSAQGIWGAGGIQADEGRKIDLEDADTIVNGDLSETDSNTQQQHYNHTLATALPILTSSSTNSSVPAPVHTPAIQQPAPQPFPSPAISEPSSSSTSAASFSAVNPPTPSSSAPPQANKKQFLRNLSSGAVKGISKFLQSPAEDDEFYLDDDD